MFQEDQRRAFMYVMVFCTVVQGLLVLASLKVLGMNSWDDYMILYWIQKFAKKTIKFNCENMQQSSFRMAQGMQCLHGMY